MNPSSQQSNLLNSEIKALLMLVLLKSGTRAEEIQTALQMAALTNLHGLQQTPEQDFTEQHETPVPAPRPQVQPVDDSRLHRLTPKQVVRNNYLAPIKGYAA